MVHRGMQGTPARSTNAKGRGVIHMQPHTHTRHKFLMGGNAYYPLQVNHG